MKQEMSHSSTSLPSYWAGKLMTPQSPLKSLDELVAWVELDLNDAMGFANSLLLMTQQDLIWTDGQRFESWPIHHGAQLLHGDHAGVGHLKLETTNSLLRIWHFTLGVNPQVLRLQTAFKQISRGDSQGDATEEVSEYDQQVCPVCLSSMPANADICPTCDPEDDKPPSTWTLFKLWRFAKPYKKDLLLGFVLTLL